MKAYLTKMGGHCVQLILSIALVAALSACGAAAGGSGGGDTSGGVIGLSGNSTASQRIDNLTNGEPIDNNITDNDLTSASLTTDYDGDGLNDVLDPDDDNDGIADIQDACRFSPLGFIANSTSDYDSDGCVDSTADADDDNDGLLDTQDSCQLSQVLFTSNQNTDYDSDGCADSTEDPDDDNDGVLDTQDNCPLSKVLYVSSQINDRDSDGCLDADEDADDDNDSITDSIDACLLSPLGFISNKSTDHDGDGCADSTADADDDNDGVLDTQDACQFSQVIFTSNPGTDYDGDGCADSAEDPDDDNDGVADTQDACQLSPLGFISNRDNDYDGDGCRDADEDADDDNDGIADVQDTDADNDGFANNADVDADGDGLIEIYSAAELNMLRNNLAGTGLSNTSGEQGNSAGCNGDVNSSDVCLGYELMNDINLQDYPNWVPIGFCSGRWPSNAPNCPAATSFATIFEGNDHTISNLSITLDDGIFYGAGLFGSAKSGAVIRNVGLQDVAVNVTDNATSWYVGSLVGVATGAQVIASNVVGGRVTGHYFVGGLVGTTRAGTKINDSYAEVAEVIAIHSRVGGLVAAINESSIANSHARTDLVRTVTNIGGKVGGLVGTVTASTIKKSFAVSGKLRIHPSKQYIGGLVGIMDDSRIDSSYAISDSISRAWIYTGGFIGFVDGNSKIFTSYSHSNVTQLSPGIRAGASGFIGGLNPPGRIYSSYAFASGIGNKKGYSGLVGRSRRTNTGGVFNSYAVTPIGLIPTSIAELNILPIRASYWDTDIASSLITNSTSLVASGRTTAELQSPTEFVGDFADWGRGWCDPVSGTFTLDLARARWGGYADNPAWDLGDSTQYPALTCLKDLSVEQQWELNTIID